jgi:hypothetical protein
LRFVEITPAGTDVTGRKWEGYEVKKEFLRLSTI